MSQRKGWLWMLAGVVFALVAGLLVYRVLSSAAETRASAPVTETRPVVIALEDLPLRTVVEEDMIAVREMPIEFIPEDAAQDVKDVLGKMVMTDINKGEVILLNRLASPTNVTRNIALTIPEEHVVIALPAQDLLNRVGMLKPGDRVDILFSLYFGDQSPDQTITLNVLQDVTIQAIVVPPVLAAAEQATNGDNQPDQQTSVLDSAILVAVTPQDALLLKYLLDSGGTLDYVLRPPDDTSAPFVEPVDIQYIEDRFEFERPNVSGSLTQEEIGEGP